MILPTLEYEQKLWSNGINYVAGVDEVGRGALAGPVVAAAVVFNPSHSPIDGVRDSKTLSKKQKQHLEILIRKQCKYVAVGEASPAEIDRLGIVPATALAMTRAIQDITQTEHLLIDGLPFKDTTILSSYQKTFIVKGDAVSYSIAAASIVAKVYRDSFMSKLSTDFSVYQFEKNVGYGTSDHLNAIKKNGYCLHHRQLFLSKLLSDAT